MREERRKKKQKKKNENNRRKVQAKKSETPFGGGVLGGGGTTKIVWTPRWVLSWKLAVGAQSVISPQAQFPCYDCLTHSLASNTKSYPSCIYQFFPVLHGQCFSWLTPQLHSLRRFQLQITFTQIINRCLTFWTENVHLCLLPSASSRQLVSPQASKIPLREPQKAELSKPWRHWGVVLQYLTSRLTLPQLWARNGTQQSECTLRWVVTDMASHQQGNNQSHQNMYETQTVVQTETHTCMEKAQNSYVTKTISPQAPEDTQKRVSNTATCFIQMREPAPVFTDATEFQHGCQGSSMPLPCQYHCPRKEHLHLHNPSKNKEEPNK